MVAAQSLSEQDGIGPEQCSRVFWLCFTRPLGGAAMDDDGDNV